MVTWTEFNSDQGKFKNSIVEIKSSDFLNGTLRITAPCTIKLIENIIVDPIGDDKSNYYYDPEQSINKEHYVYFGYRLGFFAAITIECDNVTIDLNGFELKQSRRFNLLQRFYSHIELANQPFIPNQGPANFGSEFKSANNVIIKNGKFGLSSHHSIHGNNNNNVCIRNVNIYDFEVASISLNAVKQLKIIDCTIGGNYKSIPTNGFFSASVFIRKFAEKALFYASLDNVKNDIQNKLDKINLLIGTILDLTVPDSEDKPHKLISNPSDDIKFVVNNTGLPDASALYGILVNGKGVAVNNFSFDVPTKFESTNIYLTNVNICDIEGEVIETVALSLPEKQKKIQVDTAGSVLPIFNITNENGLYKGTILSDMQITLAKWSSLNLPISDPSLKELREKGHFGTLSIHDSIVAWACTGINYMYNGNTINNQTTLEELKEIMNYNCIYGGDVMFHVNKGILGVRLESSCNVIFDNVKIKNVKNYGNYGLGKYSDFTNGGHFAQNQMLGYNGADIYGIRCSACKNVKFKHVNITNICTLNGSSFGILICDSNIIKLGNIFIDTIKTEAQNESNLPNKPVNSCGIGYINVHCVSKISEQSKKEVKNIINKFNVYDCYNCIDTTINYNVIVPIQEMNKFKTYS